MPTNRPCRATGFNAHTAFAVVRTAGVGLAAWCLCIGLYGRASGAPETAPPPSPVAPAATGCAKPGNTAKLESEMPAVIKGDYATVQHLLEAGFDPNTKGEKGITLLWRAMRENDLRAVQLLLEHGADSNARSRYFPPPLFLLLERYGPNGTVESALEMARLLLDHGADIDALDRDGRSLLRFYGRKRVPGMERLLDYLRARGAVLDPDAPGRPKRQ